jgi:L-iditol 2-dehydrogenase
MKAIIKKEKKEKAVEILEVPRPTVKEDEVLVKVINVAVCGTDLHIYEFTPGYEHIRTPLIIGHEFSGYVEEVGAKVTGFNPGDRVIGESNRYCGQCENCKKGITDLCLHSQMTGLHIDGAMAEYIAVPAYTLHKLPDNLSFVEGAIAQPISVSLNAVFDHCPIQPGDKAIVFGPGIQGIIAAQAAAIKGASYVAVAGTSQDTLRLQKAAELGFLTLNVNEQNLTEELQKAWGTSEVNIVIDCSGAVEAVQSGLSLLKRGGHLTAVGIYSKPLSLDLTKLVRSGITLHTSYTSSWKHYEQALSLIASGQLKIGTLISQYDFDSGIQAFEDGISKTAIKPILQF